WESQPRRGTQPLLPSTLHTQEVRTVAEEDLGSFHHGLRESRVRMNDQRKVSNGGAHFHGQDSLGNQLAGARAHDAYPEDAPGRGDRSAVRGRAPGRSGWTRIQDQFRQPVAAVQGE